MSERIEGWKAIAEYFPYTLNTVRQNHGPAMLKNGFVFRSHVDRHIKKYPIIWTFPELILAYLSKLQAKQGKV